MLSSRNRLAGHAKNHNRMVRDQALDALYGVVQSPLKSLKHKGFAMHTIALLAKSEANHKKITELNGNEVWGSLTPPPTYYGFLRLDPRAVGAVKVD